MRPRISLDVDRELRRRLRLAAAKHDLTIREYVVQLIEERLAQDLGQEDYTTPLTAAGDPVLTELWDNERDAAYDR
ncbi:MAG: hypothetical protein ACRDFT_10030 [bacterium]